jgi:hypothetical protein
MIVYSNREETFSTTTLIHQILAAPDPLECLIRLGQLETGIVDALCPDEDDLHPTAAELRRIATGDAPAASLRSIKAPDVVRIRAPEGYAFYSLYPVQYERAAERFAREHRPARCVVLGIRNIGTSLSAVVAKALRKGRAIVWSWTVRPHGHPFDRKLRLSTALAQRLQQDQDAWFCIVDEGPGLSGSSFASVAEAIAELGVSDDRIVLFPSHDADASSFVSETARSRWPRHTKYFEPFPVRDVIPQGARDMSGGLWREVTGSTAPAQPQHERRKYLCGGRLSKFAGLAHLGRARFERAQILSDAGFTPRVFEFRDGFIASEFIQRRSSETGADDMARYLAFIRREFATAQEVRYTDMCEMIRVNTGIECPHRNALIEDAAVIAVDGRMMPYEWVGKIKTDALDHYDDHFFPGCQDIAWDIAGASVEFNLPQDVIAGPYLAIESDPTLRRRLPFYRIAYLAYRIGYAHMAAQSLGNSPDGRKFAALKRRYTAALLPMPRPISSLA